MKVLSDWLVLCVWRALIGEIYPAIRAIALSLADDRTLLICYYLDRQPTDFDWESLEVVATNILASIGQEKILRIDLECKFEPGRLEDLSAWKVLSTVAESMICRCKRNSYAKRLSRGGSQNQSETASAYRWKA